MHPKMAMWTTPDSWRQAKKFTTVKGRQMAYVEKGAGDAIVLLHGNPTSSYLWREVIPALEGRGRCIVPDLIGMGDSEKLQASGPDRYTFAEHRDYLNSLLDQIQIGDNVTMIIHDWGSALGFHWAQQNSDRVKSIAYMEAIVRPIKSWDEWPEAARGIFQGLRSNAGEKWCSKGTSSSKQSCPTQFCGNFVTMR